MLCPADLQGTAAGGGEAERTHIARGSSGATITVVTKSGTRDFHGTAAYYKRNEKFNTNTWDRRRQCDAGQVASCAKAPYRFDNTAWTIGGPVLLPGTDFNRNRDKLFFFF